MSLLHCPCPYDTTSSTRCLVIIISNCPPSTPLCSKCSKFIWLPIKNRIKFKYCTIIFKTLLHNEPIYLRNLISRRTVSRLRSSESMSLKYALLRNSFGQSRFFSRGANGVERDPSWKSRNCTISQKFHNLNSKPISSIYHLNHSHVTTRACDSFLTVRRCARYKCVYYYYYYYVQTTSICHTPNTQKTVQIHITVPSVLQRHSKHREVISGKYFPVKKILCKKNGKNIYKLVPLKSTKTD